MIQRITDYGLSIVVSGWLGALCGLMFSDPWGGMLVGAVVGVFVGAGVRAWRTRDTRESFEERGLGD